MNTKYVQLFLLFHISLMYSQGGNIIQLPGAKLYYQTFGTGTPMLILNGGPGMSSEGFIPLAKELSKNAKTIIYDQRGTGLSEMDTMNSSTINMDIMVEDMEILREHLKIDNWILMGHSFGGMLAYYYAAKYPDRVIAMIQSSSGGMDLSLLSSLNITRSLSISERDSLQFYNKKIERGDTTYATSLKRGTFLAPAYVYKRKNIPIIAKRLTQGNSTVNELVWADLRHINYDVKSSLTSFNNPVLILHGEEDIVGREIAMEAHKILPFSKLVFMPKTRHYGWLDNPKQYFYAVKSFLTQFKTNVN